MPNNGSLYISWSCCMEQFASNLCSDFFSDFHQETKDIYLFELPKAQLSTIYLLLLFFLLLLFAKIASMAFKGLYY